MTKDIPTPRTDALLDKLCESGGRTDFECYDRLTDFARSLELRNRRLVEALVEIEKAEGAFSTDQLKHARNVIDSMTQLARAALADQQEDKLIDRKDGV